MKRGKPRRPGAPPLVRDDTVIENPGPPLAHFLIGGMRCAVMLADCLAWSNGEELFGLWRPRGASIYVSRRADAAQREDTLYHELTHAYAWTFPIPETEEDRCVWVGALMTLVNGQIAGMGGLGWLMADLEAPDSMSFRVGPWTYTALIGLPDDQPDVLGYIDCHERAIWLSPELLRERRLEILLHELRHAWDFHAPKPKDLEEECDFFALMVAQAMEDLNRQGGIPALNAMRPASAAGARPTVEPEPALRLVAG